MSTPCLTAREEEVVRLLASDHTATQIAALLCVEPHTVYAYIWRAKEVVGAKTTAGLMVKLIEAGLLRMKIV